MEDDGGGTKQGPGSPSHHPYLRFLPPSLSLPPTHTPLLSSALLLYRERLLARLLLGFHCASHLSSLATRYLTLCFAFSPASLFPALLPLLISS